MELYNKGKICKRIWKICMFLVSFIFIIQFGFSVSFQMEWGNATTVGESWLEINLTNTYVSPVVVATPVYSVTSQIYGVDTWVTNVTSKSFKVRSSNEHFSNTDNILIQYIVMEQGAWTLPDSTIKVEAGIHSTNKVGSQSTGWTCPSYGDVISFTNAFNANPLLISTRGSDNNVGVWASTFQNDPASQTQPVTTTSMCQGLSQSRATSPGIVSLNETIYWIAAEEGNGSLGGVEFEILWNLQDTGDSGGNWINGYGDAKPFTQSWAHTWVGAPNIIVASQTSVGGSDGSWPVIYDVGNTASIRMFVDEANERAHSGSESGGGWAFDRAGNFGNFAPNNVNVSFEKNSIFINEVNLINATVTDSGGNNTISEVIVSVYGPSSSFYNVSLSPEIIFENLTSNDVESATSNYTAISDGEIIGEAGRISLYNRTSKIIKFTQSYNQTPILIAIAVTQNNDESPFIPIIHSINTTEANISLCRDNGAITCDNNYVAENVSYAVFDVAKTNNYSWIEVGKVNTSTNGGATAFSFSKTFVNAPYIWALPQTYNIGSSVANGIAAMSWFTSITTTGANIVGCDHPGTANSCAGTAIEEFGYVAIDINSENLKDFSAGTQTISGSAWTGISFGRSYNNPEVFVMVNSETGGQDPKYPWAKTLSSNGASIRYCEADTANYCDSHNGEITRWFALENGPIGVGNGGDDIEKNLTIKTYDDIFSNTTHNIINLSVYVNVTEYNNSGSVLRGNNLPDLELDLAVSLGGWKSLGSLNISGVGEYVVFVNDSQILDAWSQINLRDIRVRGVNFDYASSTLIDRIFWNVTYVSVNYKTYTSIWQANFTNTSICGVYNLTDLYSKDIGGLLNHTSYSNINFSIACNPIINLLYPINYTKVLSNKTVEFKFFVDSSDSNMSCDLYVNSIFRKNVVCFSGVNNSINLTLERGLYNWSVNVMDSNNLSTRPIEEYFYNIVKKGVRVSKEILYENVNQYLVKLRVDNLISDTILDVILLDFSDTEFVSGSFNPVYNFTNVVSSGNIFGWNLSINSLGSENINYSIAGVSDYNLEKNYRVGLD